MGEGELAQLRTLGLPDQAAVVASRLGSSLGADGSECSAEQPGRARKGPSSRDEPLPTLIKTRNAGGAEVRVGPEAGAPPAEPPAGGGAHERGERRLASLVVGELASPLYSITHGLLAGLPVSAVVTTNYDDLFESAWRAAQVGPRLDPYPGPRIDPYPHPHPRPRPRPRPHQVDFNVLPYETQL